MSDAILLYGELNLNDNVTYFLTKEGFKYPSPALKQQYADSALKDGQLPTEAWKFDNRVLTFSIFVRGTDGATLDAALRALYMQVYAQDATVTWCPAGRSTSFYFSAYRPEAVAVDSYFNTTHRSVNEAIVTWSGQAFPFGHTARQSLETIVLSNSIVKLTAGLPADPPQITVTGLSTGNAARLYDNTGTVYASAVESGGTATLDYVLPLNVMDFGAIGDGVTDDTASINAAIAALDDGDTLYFPAGTYVVKAPAAGTYAILPLDQTNITVMGDGVGVSTIQVADNCPTHKAILSNWLVSSNPDISGLEVCDLTLDHNIANNPITDLAEVNAWTEDSISVANNGSDIHIHDVEIKNASSYNNICITDEGVGGCTRLTIERITASGIGTDGVSPHTPIAHDASFIFVHTDTYSVSDCVLSCDTPRLPGQVCAIEVHGTNYTIEDNTITNFSDSIAPCGISEVPLSNTVIQNNTMTGCLRGMMILSQKWGAHQSGYGIDGLTITGNAIDIIPYASVDTDTRLGIYVDPGCDLDINALTIDNNTITLASYDSAAGGGTPSSCGIGAVKNPAAPITISNFAITNNHITNFPFSAIWLDDNLDTVAVTGNAFTNCASTLAAGTWDAFKSYVWLDSPTIDTVDISDNIFVDSIATSRLKFWFFLYSDIASSTGLTIEDNTFTLSGDGASLVKQIEIYGNNAQPLITGTITGFIHPAGQVNTASVVHSGALVWTTVDGLTWVSA